jgi:hypothetical protein
MSQPLPQPDPPDPNRARYCAQPFPQYRYVPTLNPHPCAHPDGHSYEPPGHPKPAPPPLLPPEQWRACEAWLYGVDLYNHAYWWETHEIWEAIWQQSDKKGVQGRFIQGLIQIAAAHLKRHIGNEEGVQRLLERSRAHLDFAQAVAPAVYMGVEIVGFRRSVESWFAGDAETIYPFITLVPA